MKKINSLSFCALLISLLTTARVHGEKNQGVRYTLDFSSGHSLKIVFDAGLRPWLFPGDVDHCNLGKENLKFILPGNQSFFVNAERVGIDVLANNEINSIGISCAPATLADGVTQVRKIGQPLGLETQSLDEFLQAFSNGKQKGFGWGVGKNIDGIRVNIGYTIIPEYQNAASEVLITLEWLVPSNERMKFLTSPIKPPPGYENVSMAPPTDNLTRIPFSSSTVQQQLGLASNGQSAATTINSVTVQNQTRAPPAVSSVQPKTGQSAFSPPALVGSSWTLWVLLAVLVAIAVIYALRRK